MADPDMSPEHADAASEADYLAANSSYTIGITSWIGQARRLLPVLAAAVRDLDTRADREAALADRLADALVIAEPAWTDWVEGKAALAAYRTARGTTS